MDESTKATNPLFIPMAIILAGLIIGGAIYLKDPTTPAPSAEDPELTLANIRPIETTDHLRGNPDAPIVILEYSDLECPFCKLFNNTMLQIMEEFSPSGQVAWVYRHFPLRIHPKASIEAEAAECVAELGGEDAFWEYHDRIFEVTPSNNGLDLAQLPQLAIETGVNATDFTNCLESHRHQQRIEDDSQNAIDSGATGTPFNVLYDRDGKPHFLGGAVPLEDLRALIQSLL